MVRLLLLFRPKYWRERGEVPGNRVGTLSQLQECLHISRIVQLPPYFPKARVFRQKCPGVRPCPYDWRQVGPECPHREGTRAHQRLYELAPRTLPSGHQLLQNLIPQSHQPPLERARMNLRCSRRDPLEKPARFPLTGLAQGEGRNFIRSRRFLKIESSRSVIRPFAMRDTHRLTKHILPKDREVAHPPPYLEDDLICPEGSSSLRLHNRGTQSQCVQHMLELRPLGQWLFPKLGQLQEF